MDADEGPNLDEDSYTDLGSDSPQSPELLSQVRQPPRQITPNSSARRQLGPRLEETFEESENEVQGTQMDPVPPEDFDSQLNIARFMANFATTVREREVGVVETTRCRTDIQDGRGYEHREIAEELDEERNFAVNREIVDESDDGVGGGLYEDDCTHDGNGMGRGVEADKISELDSSPQSEVDIDPPPSV